MKATYHKAWLERGETLVLSGAPHSLSLGVFAIGDCACIAARETWSTNKPTARRKDAK
jgi:hypothetical protein